MSSVSREWIMDHGTDAQKQQYRDEWGYEETYDHTEKDAVQREGMKERGQNVGLDPTDVGRDPYDSKADETTSRTRWVRGSLQDEDATGNTDDRSYDDTVSGEVDGGS